MPHSNSLRLGPNRECTMKPGRSRRPPTESCAPPGITVKDPLAQVRFRKNLRNSILSSGSGETCAFKQAEGSILKSPTYDPVPACLLQAVISTTDTLLRAEWNQ